MCRHVVPLKVWMLKSRKVSSGWGLQNPGALLHLHQMGKRGVTLTYMKIHILGQTLQDHRQFCTFCQGLPFDAFYSVGLNCRGKMVRERSLGEGIVLPNGLLSVCPNKQDFYTCWECKPLVKLWCPYIGRLGTGRYSTSISYHRTWSSWVPLLWAQPDQAWQFFPIDGWQPIGCGCWSLYTGGGGAEQ